MTADFHPHPAEPPKDEAAEKTLNIRVERERKTRRIVTAVLALALVAGISVAVLLKKLGGGADPISSPIAGSVSGAAGSANEAATGIANAAATCPNPDDDPIVAWYCQQVKPAFEKAAADHARIDRLEAEGRGGVPFALWVIVAAIGVLTVYNTVEARRERSSKKR